MGWGYLPGLPTMARPKPHRHTMEPPQRSTLQEEVQELLHHVPRSARPQDSFSFYCQVIESSPDLISVVGRDYRYRHVNPAYQRAHGLPTEDIIGQSVADLLGQEQFDHTIRPKLDRCLAGETLSYESWFHLRAAGRRYLGVTYSPLCTSPEQVEGAVVTARDLTALREAQERLRFENLRLEEHVEKRTRELGEANRALRANEERFRAFYENSPSMYFIVDQNGIVLSANQFGTEQLGYAPEEITGRPVVDIFHPDDRTAAFQALAGAFADPHRPHQWQFRKGTKSGELVWVQETVRSIQEPSGRRVALIVCQDITAQVRSERLLRESEQAIRSLQSATSTPGVPFDDRIHAVLELGCRRFGLPIGIFTRIEGENLQLSHVWPPSAPLKPGTRLALCRTFCGSTFNREGPLFIQDARKSEWRSHPAFVDLTFVSYLGTKLSGTHETYGTICFLGYAPYPEPFTESQADYLALMARWISDELDRQTAELALRESRELFAVAFRSSPHPVIISELATGRCIEVNDVSLSLFGYGREEVLGRTTVDLGLWPTSADREHFVARLMRDGRLRDEELLLRSKDGRWLHCRASCELITLNGLRCILTVGHDVTEQRQTELALRQSEERFRRLFEDSPIGMVIIGEDRTIRKINPSFRILVGYEEEEILGHTYALYTHPDDLSHNVTLTNQFMSGDLSCYTIEKRFIRKNGSQIWVSVTVSPLMLPGVNERMGVAIVQDITARKLAEQALEHRERDLRHALQEREQVSQDLHDGILQSLYAVGLSLDAAGRLVDSSPRRAKREVTGAISQLNRTIQDVRNFITGLSLDLLDVDRLTQALQMIVAPFCKPGRTRCDILVSAEAIERLARPSCVHLVNIVREAVSNSVRHGRATRIRITLRPVRDRVQLAIKDNGHGFDPEAALKRGYGLRNMRSRAAKLGGALTILSTQGSGTRIVATFAAEDST